eukprot:13819494-Alexandrium_andersonii.AAC.1
MADPTHRIILNSIHAKVSARPAEPLRTWGTAGRKGLGASAILQEEDRLTQPGPKVKERWSRGRV